MRFFKRFTIWGREWTNDHKYQLRELAAHPYFPHILLLINNRIVDRTEELVNGKETRERIDELKDLILELQSYADPLPLE